MFDPSDEASPWSAEGMTVYTTYRMMKEQHGADYAQQNYVDQWQAQVDDHYQNFYVRHPEFLDALPEKYKIEIRNNISRMLQYCEMPLMSLAFLVLQWKLVSAHAKAVHTLTDAAPMDAGKYLLLQCAAIGTAWLLLACCVAALGVGFLLNLFAQAVSLSALVLPALVVLLPLLIFLMGLGLLAGGIHPGSLIILAPLLMVMGMLPLPFSMELFGASFFSGYPLALAVPDPAFVLPVWVLISKAVYLILGVLFLVLACRRRQKRI